MFILSCRFILFRSRGHIKCICFREKSCILHLDKTCFLKCSSMMPIISALILRNSLFSLSMFWSTLSHPLKAILTWSSYCGSEGLNVGHCQPIVPGSVRGEGPAAGSSFCSCLLCFCCSCGVYTVSAFIKMNYDHFHTAGWQLWEFTLSKQNSHLLSQFRCQ